MKVRVYWPVLVILGLLISSCASSQSAPEEVVDKGEELMMEDETMMEDDLAADHEDEMESDESMMDDEMNSPVWFSVPLVDVHTDASFTIDEHKGQVVLVETMAVWCSNCLRQQREVQALHAALGEREDFISIALDIDPNENMDILRNFASQNGFNWLYVVAPRDVANELGELYGQQFLNPPSTPILLVDRQGVVHPLPFGIKSAEELQASVEELLESGM